jgi:hypothetical protein
MTGVLMPLGLILPFLFATTPATTPAPCACVEPPPEPQVLEVTFGSAQLFEDQAFTSAGGLVQEQVIPVTSALLMVEWLLRERLSVLSLFNLPLTTQKKLVDGQVQEEFVAPSIALGARFSALRLQVFAASHLELQLAALAGITIGSTSASGDTVFPLAAGRIHFSNQNGFALYLGTAFAFRKDTLAVLYGIGHRF